MDDMIDIVVSGHLCLDIIPEMADVALSELPSPGRLFEVGPVTVATGGAVSNTGLALHVLGADVRLVANVGDDLVSHLILDYLRSHSGVLVEHISTMVGSASSYTVVLSPGRSDRIFLHCTGTNATFGFEHIDFDLVARSRVFHLGYPPILPRLYADNGRELMKIFQRAKELGVVTSLDLSLPDPAGSAGTVDWRTILSRTLPFVDIFVPSIDEIAFMLRRNEYDQWSGRCAAHVRFTDLAEMSTELLDMGAAVVGFKLGEYGFYLRGGSQSRLNDLMPRLQLASWVDQVSWHPAYKVDVAGTTGAGDSAYAGLLVAMLRGSSIFEAAQFAAAVGAHNVERADAISGMKSAEQIYARIKGHWQTLAFEPPP